MFHVGHGSVSVVCGLLTEPADDLSKLVCKVVLFFDRVV